MNNKFTLLNQKRLINLSKKNLKRTPLIKTVIKGQKNTAGKNNSGKITIYHKGGGHKKKYRKINLIRNNDSIGILTSSLEYDPYRTPRLAKTAYEKGLASCVQLHNPSLFSSVCSSQMQ